MRRRRRRCSYRCRCRGVHGHCVGSGRRRWLWLCSFCRLLSRSPDALRHGLVLLIFFFTLSGNLGRGLRRCVSHTGIHSQGRSSTLLRRIQSHLRHAGCRCDQVSRCRLRFAGTSCLCITALCRLLRTCRQGVGLLLIAICGIFNLSSGLRFYRTLGSLNDRSR